MPWIAEPRSLGRSLARGANAVSISAMMLALNGSPRWGLPSRPPALVTRGDAKIDYRRFARACERDNPNSRHRQHCGERRGHQRHEWHGRAAPIWPAWLRLPERENYIEVQWRNPNARKWQTICAASIFAVP